jgi:hypothetical protein
MDYLSQPGWLERGVQTRPAQSAVDGTHAWLCDTWDKSTRKGPELMQTNLKIDAARLWGTLMETARFGALQGGGIKRLAASAEDKLVRDWFGKACTNLGLTISIDAVGNMFARRAGKNPELPPILMGSHLDTQPTGGKFDGILGVLAALEAARTLVQAGFETYAPLEIVNWTNEEGARFSPAMLASGAFAGVFTPAQALSTADRDGVTLDVALQNIDYKGIIPVGGREIHAYFELHIEQGPILEAEAHAIGIVTGGMMLLSQGNLPIPGQHRCTCARMRWSARPHWHWRSRRLPRRMHRWQWDQSARWRSTRQAAIPCPARWY